jgi:hypothetical protein
MQIEAETVLFGVPSTRAVLSVRSRSTSWRAAGAAAFMGGSMVLAAVLAVVPPHAPWLIGALVLGAVLARRRWMERYTLDSLRTECPKCGEALNGRPGRLKTPHPVPCEGCHHQSTVRIEPSLLGGLA